jgi:hypothetical protein
MQKPSVSFLLPCPGIISLLSDCQSYLEGV